MFQHLELDDIEKQNKEVKLDMYKDIFFKYLKCLIYYPTNITLRKKFLRLMNGFFTSLKNECIIFEKLDTALISQEDFDEILDDLDNLFTEGWLYYDSILEDLDYAISSDYLDRITKQNEVVKMIDENKKKEILNLILSKEKNNRNI